MEWQNTQERDSIYASARLEYEREILVLTEWFALGGTPDALTEENLASYSPDQILNALLLIFSHFTGGEEFFDQLHPILKSMVTYQMVLVIEASAEFANRQSHKGEADESLMDSEEKAE